MPATFNHAQIKQLEEVIERVLDKKLGEDYLDRIDRIKTTRIWLAKSPKIRRTNTQ